MLKIGLTGGIGSGKSTVAGIFEVLGIPVYYADAAAKRLMNEDPDLRAEIVRLFGSESYVDDQLNRKYLADTVFSNPRELDRLNAMVHPATLRDAGSWMKQQHSPYVIKEAALIFESGADKDLDYVIGVKASEPVRIERTIQRDHISEEQVLARINQQLPEAEKMEKCDYIIINDETTPLIPQVLALHMKFIDFK